jgi:phosphatidylserine decarboxylase
MSCVDRNGNQINQNETQNKVLSFLYRTPAGRCLLPVLVRPFVSKLAGVFLDSRCSRFLIAPFVERNGIDLSEYEERKYISYNDFFTRQIKTGSRHIDMDPSTLIAPCDSKLSVYPIGKKARFRIKNTSYTLESLLRDKKLARHYEGGWLFVFRLTVDDYHRYCYVDKGVKTRNHHISGVFHTVNPLAGEVCPIYKENTREYSILKSENFGNILMMEVGALLVGRIVNNHEQKVVRRGEEKGRFEFGGSTVILALERERVSIDADILANSGNNLETVVKMGERIGRNMYATENIRISN